ncbi:WSC domain-containing protein ARB_07867 [Nematostella vectensis]|uniref:WSC domain-containing protein ARB_07867 n=1 Tax=Nematostella vectensis TaxID=45351 RepID=UPI002076F7AD|nr:WSC domain-containing protein ARB_07867 [Nematostella vectensis]
MLSKSYVFVMLWMSKFASRKARFFVLLTSTWIFYVISAMHPDLYLGCYKDGFPRDIGSHVTISDLTPTKCIQRCLQLGHMFVGLQYSTACFCGDSYGRYYVLTESDCAYGCGGNGNLKCGAAMINSVYRSEKLLSQFLGCYKEGTPRDLWGDQSLLDGTLSAPEVCVERCKKRGFHFAAVKNYAVCSCGVSFGRYGKANPKDCNPKCSNGEHCSAADANSIYRTEADVKPLPQPAHAYMYATKETAQEGNLPIIRDYVIYTEKDVPEPNTCMHYCELVPACQSINHDPVTMVCEMNNVTSAVGAPTTARESINYWEPLAVSVQTFPMP